MPKVRREHGLRAIEAARKALASQAVVGKDPRASAQAGRKRGEANAQQIYAIAAGSRAARCEPDHAWFEREVAPKL